MRLEVELEGAEAADDVLRRIGAVDAEDQLLGAPLDQVALGGQNLVALGKVFELRDVDRDRMGSDPCAPPPVVGGAVDEVRVRTDEVARGAQEVHAPAVCVEADHVVREQAVVDRLPHRPRQDVPVVRLRPRDVDEVGEQRVGDPLADETGREVQVVVVEEDRRVRVELQLLDDRIGEAVVHAGVAFVPCVLQRDVDRRRVGELPEVVLEEP